jgi:hypothetical protein
MAATGWKADEFVVVVGRSFDDDGRFAGAAHLPLRVRLQHRAGTDQP